MFSAGARRRCALGFGLTTEIRSKSSIVAVQKRVQQQRCIVRNPLTLSRCQGNTVKQNDLALCGGGDTPNTRQEAYIPGRRGGVNYSRQFILIIFAAKRPDPPTARPPRRAIHLLSLL